MRVEKREQGKTITIKINGKQQAFDDPKQKQNKRQGQIIDKAIPLSTDEEISTKESIEMKDSVTINESAAADEQNNNPFDWILPETPSTQPDVEEYMVNKEDDKPKKAPSGKWFKGKSKINRGIFATIFFAVFLAVILGTSFGFTMLKLVFIEKPEENDVVLNASTMPQQNQAEKPQSGSGKLAVELPPFSTWVVQEGAYSNQGSAKQVVTSLKEKGTPASIFEDEPRTFIFLGVADTKEHAKEYGSGLSGIDEPFAKEISVGGKKISGLNEQEKVYLEGLPTFFASMTLAASTGVVSENALTSVTDQAKKLGDGKSIKHDQIKSLKEQSDKAIKSLQALEKSADKKDKIALQQNLLSILTTYHGLK